MSKHTRAKTKTLSPKPLAALIPMLVFAAPIGAVETGHVAAGSGTINTQGATTTINQQSDRMIVNWNNFDIRAGEMVQFNQPSTSSAVLNRVNSANPTQIGGALNANGRVFVVNPNGVVVGKTGSIRANGVVLSTLDVANNTFMAMTPSSNGYAYANFHSTGATSGAVVNEGVISSGAGGVSLFGAQVINGAAGSIYAKGVQTALGNGVAAINLVAADSVDVIANGSSGSYIVNQTGAGSATLTSIANDGVIRNDYGLVNMTVESGSNASLRNTGLIEAHGSSRENGGISLRNKSTGGSSSTSVGGSLDGESVIVYANNNTTIDGLIKGGTISAEVSGANSNATLLIADNAQLSVEDRPSNWNPSFLQLIGDKVVVNGQVSSSGTAEVRSYNSDGVSIRKDGLNAPTWTINDGGTITTGKGSY